MEIQSNTTLGVVYETTVDSCTCKGFFYRGTCTHQRAVKEAGL